MNSFIPSSFHLISEFIYIGIFHMPTSHIFVVENGVSKKVSKLSRRYRHYKEKVKSITQRYVCYVSIVIGFHLFNVYIC